MKNENNLIPTHFEKLVFENGEELILKLDINSKTEIINGIYFTGSKANDFTLEIEFLAKEISQMAIADIPKFLSKHSMAFNLPTSLLFKFIQNYYGIYQYNGSKDLICSCFSFSKTDLKNGLDQSQFTSLAEIMGKSKVSLGCGKCESILKREYLKLCNEFYSSKSFNENFNAAGEWLHFKNLTYAQTLIAIDDEIQNWSRENNEVKNALEIVDSRGYHLGIKLHSNNFFIAKKLIAEKLQELIFSRLGLLVFFELKL